MAQTVFFFLRRAVAIALGGTLTAYSAWASWTHSHDVLGPLAAVSAAVLLALCERAWHDRQVIRLVLLGTLGIAAAVFSGSVVLERIAHAQAARLSASRTDNLPRLEAERSLSTARSPTCSRSSPPASCRPSRFGPSSRRGSPPRV
jgi:hypothetical protein